MTRAHPGRSSAVLDDKGKEKGEGLHILAAKLRKKACGYSAFESREGGTSSIFLIAWEKRKKKRGGEQGVSRIDLFGPRKGQRLRQTKAEKRACVRKNSFLQPRIPKERGGGGRKGGR